MSSLYKKLIVWQKAMLLTEEVYTLTKRLPGYEDHNLASQMRRSAVSVPSNIAEGQYRFSLAQIKQFFKVAYASCAELETQLYIAERVGYFKNGELTKAYDLVEQVMRMLNRLIYRRAD